MAQGGHGEDRRHLDVGAEHGQEAEQEIDGLQGQEGDQEPLPLLRRRSRAGYFHPEWEMRAAVNTWKDSHGAPRINASLEFPIPVTADPEEERASTQIFFTPLENSCEFPICDIDTCSHQSFHPTIPKISPHRGRTGLCGWYLILRAPPPSDPAPGPGCSSS